MLSPSTTRCRRKSTISKSNNSSRDSSLSSPSPKKKKKTTIENNNMKANSTSLTTSSSSTKNNSNDILSQENNALQSFTNMELEKDDLSEINLNELYKLAIERKFPKKLFIFNDTKRRYSPRLHFYDSIRVFSCDVKEAQKKLVKFICKICNRAQHAYFGSIQNLNSHLKSHTEFKNNWLDHFEAQTVKGTKLIDDNTFELVRAVISANLPLAILENEHFAKCLKMDLCSVKIFRNDVLPKAYNLMIKAIDKKLNNAKFIYFITDIWTNKNMADFLALAAIIVKDNDKPELCVIGMKSMEGDHTAEHIKIVIEDIVNGFKFNKNIAKGLMIFLFNEYYYFFV